MALSPGTRVGSFEIVSLLGAGGMGEVYRARDSKLKRDVAIKVLPEAFARDPERVARFEREAEVLARLNHPNVAAVYGFEESSEANGIVMEFVDGPTLADRIASGAIPLAQALPIARQIAEALEAAHERGIVHRDLKPPNIKLTTSDQLKVLDFGLAKMLAGDTSGTHLADVTASPTRLSPVDTGLGTILGTAAYMSPEQAAARPTDKRADIWSFGVILWEMLTGRRLFDAETVSHTIADVLRAPIDFQKLPVDTPHAIRELIGRCLERDAKNRLRDIGEARVAIDHTLSGTSAVVPAPAVRRSSRSAVMASGAAALAFVAATALALVYFREPSPAMAPLMRFQILPPEQTTLTSGMVVSPDGSKLAFVGFGADSRRVLWLREVGGLTARPMAGTEGANIAPFWSPDGRMLAFGVNGSPHGTLKRVDVTSGVVQTVCSYSGDYRAGSWSVAGSILFGAGRAGLVSVPQFGGEPSSVTTVNVSRQETQHALPVFLPDGRRFLYFRAAGTPDHMGVYLGSLDTAAERQDETRLIAASGGLAYVEDPRSGGGWVLFQRQASMFAQAIDARGSLRGEPQLLADDVGSTGNHGWFSVSSTGALVYRSGDAADALTELLWADRLGKRLSRLGSGGDIGGGGVQLSPDGKRILITRPDERLRLSGMSTTQAARAWIADTNRGVFSRLSADEGSESGPAFAPDGRVIFSSRLNAAVGDLYRISGNGIGRAEPLLVKSATVKHPNSVSPDGRFLMFDDHSLTQQQDLWILPLDRASGAARKALPFLVTPADETASQFSPDGKWVAYSSDESGRREVYVQGFAPDRVPAAAVGKWQISTAGGDKPRWSRNGKELYYLAGGKMMAVPVTSGPASFEPGLAVPLFDTRLTGFFPYDVSADGRFLLQAIADDGPVTASPVTVLLNWQGSLKR